MPELPEVEANRQNLARWTLGRRILRAEPPPGRAAYGDFRRLSGRKVEEVGRRGKWILVRLDGPGLGIHLGMTGKLVRAEEPPRFTRASFEMSDGGRVRFVDMRRFGRVWVTESYEALLARPGIVEIGPDALSELDVPRLRAALEGTSRTVKETIMDPGVMGGVGNLYATEALWRAKIHPASPARGVDAAALLRGIRAALRHGIRTYQGEELPEYIEEGAPNPFFAYDRKGEPCPRCATRMKALTIGGRTSAFCPRCQKKSGTKRTG